MNNQLALDVIKLLTPDKRYLTLTLRMSGEKWTLYDKERNPVSLVKLSLVKSMKDASLLKEVTHKKTGEKRLILSRRGILQLHGKTIIKKGYKAIR